MTLRFGTDGIRGHAGVDLTAALVEALGRAGAETLGSHEFVVGRDTRESGPELSRALHRGVAAAGGDSVDLGVVPTPAVARWCADERVAGAMVSASHNSWRDNGVKLFAPGGLKLDDDTQAAIERRFSELLDRPTGGADTTPLTVRDGSAQARDRHVAAVVASLDGRDLGGMRIVCDAANGAASEIAPAALRRLGADVVTIHADPDGRNINERCGSTHPESAVEAVGSVGADLGLAFDGDADRVLGVADDGRLVDGDHIIALCAIDRNERGLLGGSAVVVTVMTNLGFRRAMAERGIEVVDTAVGDRHVLEALDTRGLQLGGEQSGHVIFRDLATTGDGLLTAVQLVDLVKRRGRPLSELAAEAMTRLPQVLVGLTLPDRPPDLMERVAPLVRESERRLGESGRVLVRPSGTEPLLRIMIEADDDDTAASETERLTGEITALLR